LTPTFSLEQAIHDGFDVTQFFEKNLNYIFPIDHVELNRTTKFISCKVLSFALKAKQTHDIGEWNKKRKTQ